MNFEERDTYGIYRGYKANGLGPDISKGPWPALMGANTLIGTDVYNRQSEHLGDIKEIMLDMRSGHVAYAVLSFGGFLGLGEKLFAVPWAALSLEESNKCFILSVEAERLKQAPGFDKDHWPNMADQHWASQIHAYYGVKHYGNHQ